MVTAGCLLTRAHESTKEIEMPTYLDPRDKPLSSTGVKGDLQSLTQVSNMVQVINAAILGATWFNSGLSGQSIQVGVQAFIALGAGITGYIGRRRAEKKVVQVLPVK
jgi:hypothetical protein